MKKKSIFGYSLLLLLVVGSIVFSACAKQKAKAENFEFSYRQNSAQKVSEGEDKVVKLCLSVKNTAGEKNQLKAELFKLKLEGQDYSKSSYFGNNIIDKMETEDFEKDGQLDVVLSLVLNQDLTGSYELWYGENKLIKVRI